MKLKEIIIIGSILVASLVLWLILELTKQPGEIVIVRIDGVEVAEYSLLIDGIYELNEGTNILHIEDGKAWLEDATCPDKLCVKQGKINKNGETITCLPYKLTVTVYGKDDFVEIRG